MEALKIMINKLNLIREELEEHLFNGIIPFWAERGVDNEFGGYLTCFDKNGTLDEKDSDKYIIMQTRMIWGFSLFYKLCPAKKEYLIAAQQGVDFFIKHFWDEEHGGWFWKTKRDGVLVDNGKVVYGQSFAIYALSEYYLATNDARGLQYAEKTFDLLQKYCVDSARGGYYENLEVDWQLSDKDFCAGDRKSLDIHMHQMECYTTLALASGKEIHKRRLQEVIYVVLKYMVNLDIGYGRNQFDLEFNPIPAIAIRRTFNAERDESETIDTPKDSTSYGHNVELGWLLVRAGEVLGQKRDFYKDIIINLANYAIEYGIDKINGGIYRDGTHAGKVLVKDKEFWQNGEVLVGFLDIYEITKEEKYLHAFENTWSFVRKYMINKNVGEWKTLVSEDGETILSSDLGTAWKACYHSGRSLYEAIKRIKMILDKETGDHSVLTPILLEQTSSPQPNKVYVH